MIVHETSVCDVCNIGAIERMQELEVPADQHRQIFEVAVSVTGSIALCKCSGNPSRCNRFQAIQEAITELSSNQL